MTTPEGRAEDAALYFPQAENRKMILLIQLLTQLLEVLKTPPICPTQAPVVRTSPGTVLVSDVPLPAKTSL